MIPSSSFLLPLAGGVLIGLSATLLLALHGRVAGISGILGSAISTTVAPKERRWRLEFLLGLAGAGALLRLLVPEQFSSSPASSLLVVGLAGALVGFGTRLGSGCTSGHGVCGISRLSLRSMVATLTFIAFGALTVFLVKQLGGAA
ncbi:MAG: YeeE/YedE family protein [Sorangiineae bacterium NIC37A_2]|nr:MAG: YeeE/YedE family protein [Sorangiineae bacterium NIC37A_2]